MAHPMPSTAVLDVLRRGTVIPAHPLALTQDGKFDERHQRALTRYYCAAGAGGVAVGVHTTQFEIRQPQHGLFKPVLELARETAAACAASLGRPVVLIGGICGKTPQALEEAAFLNETGYDAGLLSLAALKDETVIKRFADLGTEPVPLEKATPQALKSHLLAEIAKWAPIIEAAGAKGN